MPGSYRQFSATHLSSLRFSDRRRPKPGGCSTEEETRSQSASESVPTLYLGAGAEPIAGYRLIRLVGEGGFGVVWEAEAPGGVRVALKFVRLDDRRSARELRALDIVRNIRHPHLLDVQFAVRCGNCLVLGMPLCDRSLSDRLRACRATGRPGVPLGELLRYMRELAGAIDYLNEPRHPVGAGGRLAGIQHRDIKPRNILLAGGSARLADFGLAKLLEANMESHSGCMSADYVAPEQLRGRVSRFSDQYALAVTYHQLRTGRLPFTGSTGEVLDGHLHRPPDLSGLPEGERQAVGRALEKSPEGRWPTCREFVRQLERAAARPERDSDMTAPASTASDETAYVGADDGAAVQQKVAAARRGECDLAGARVHHGPRSRRRPFGRVAVGFGIIGLTAVLCASVAPSMPSGLGSRGSNRPTPHRRRGSGVPSRQSPAFLRSSQSGRRTRNQTYGGSPWEILRFEAHCRRSAPRLGRSAPDFARPPRAVARGYRVVRADQISGSGSSSAQWPDGMMRSAADVPGYGPLDRACLIGEPS